MSVEPDSEASEEQEYFRRRAIRALGVHFTKRRAPRTAMSFVLMATGSVGFLGSWVMLHAGIHSMWMRYPLAVLVGWAAFLPLVRLWAELERSHLPAPEEMDQLLHEREAEEPKPVAKSGRSGSGDWSFLDWLDLPDFDADGDGCAIGILLAVAGALLLAVGWAVITVLTAAPVLIAEVFLDAVLVAALYKRMKSLDRRWWLAGAVRHTIGPVFVTAVMLMALGAVMHIVAPEAKSVGGVVRHFREGKKHSPRQEATDLELPDPGPRR